MEAWIGVIGTLLGGVLVGLFTHWTSSTQSKQQIRWQLVRLTQDKLEELAQVLDEFEHHYRKLSGAALMKVETGKPMAFEGERIPCARLATLIQFYAPELTEDKKKLDKAAENYGALLAEAIPDTVRTKPEKQVLNGKLIAGAHSISVLCSEMTSKAASLVHEKVAEEMSNIAFKRGCRKSAAAP